MGVVIGYAIAKSTGICSNGSPQGPRITEVVTPTPVAASADMPSKVSYALAGVSPRPAPSKRYNYSQNWLTVLKY